MKTLFTCGDSWTFGSEIVAPEFLAPIGKGYGMSRRLIDNFNDVDVRNNYYREPRTWPAYLGALTRSEVINHGWPARSNDTIISDTMHWVLKNYITPKRDTSELMVVIGWSSPERKNIIVENFDDTINEFTIWPAMLEDKYYDGEVAKRYFQFHVNHLWTEKESLTRFIDQNLFLHLFLESHGIKHYFFNSFYVPKGGMGFETWRDIPIKQQIDALRTKTTHSWQEKSYSLDDQLERLSQSWELIPEKVFVNKSTCESFKTYVEKTIDAKLAWCGIHPSPESNEAWAKYLFEWIKNHE